MSLNSLSFMLFVAVTVFVYYVLPKKCQWVVLLCASYCFYLFSGIKPVVYIIATTCVTYFAARWMQKLRENFEIMTSQNTKKLSEEELNELKRKVSKKIHMIQVYTVLINLGVLVYVKFLNFFLDNFNNLFTMFKWDVSIPLVNVIVPLGLSYYTFNSIGYLIDVGRGRLEAEKHFGKFALFISFFPSIVQGPLLRYGDVGAQLKETHKFEYNNIVFGSQLILWGLFKKMIIADRFALISNAIFAPGFQGYSGSHIFFGAIAYSFQLYGDFSGGIDITRGVAQMLGIDLPQNFARPFFATSLADYWKRWHMSLGAWMREYVFYPVMLSKGVTSLSKKFRKKYGSHIGKLVPSVIAPLVVFFLINIWHGLSWQRIINGLYNALIISSSVALAPLYKKISEKLHIKTNVFSFRLFQMLRTFFVLTLSRIVLKAPSLTDTWKMLKAFFTDVDWAYITGVSGEIYTYGVDEKEMVLLLIALLVLLIVGILQERGIKIRETLAQQNIVFRWGLIYALFFAVLIFGQYGPGYDASAFIYGGY